MMADLKKRKLLFKVKKQLANNNSSKGGDEWCSTEINGRMRSGKAKIVCLVEEHLQTKKKSEWEGE
jgi:hypothetical protein